MFTKIIIKNKLNKYINKLKIELRFMSMAEKDIFKFTPNSKKTHD